jgi:hypothetical protein
VKLILLVIAIVFWTIAALLAVGTGTIGSHGPGDFVAFGLPFFGTSFLPKLP